MVPVDNLQAALDVYFSVSAGEVLTHIETPLPEAVCLVPGYHYISGVEDEPSIHQHGSSAKPQQMSIMFYFMKVNIESVSDESETCTIDHPDSDGCLCL